MSAVGCRRALAHFSVCDCCLPPAKPHQLARTQRRHRCGARATNSSYDCNRNGNRAEILRVCTVRPLSPTLRGSKGGVSSNLIGSNVFGWLLARSYFSRIARRGRRGKTGFLQMKPGIVVGMPNQQFFLNALARSSFSRIARGRGKTGYFQMKLSSTYKNSV